MAVSLLAALVLTRPVQRPDAWTTFAHDASVEARRRRPDLADLGRRGRNTLSSDEFDALLARVRASWKAGRAREAMATARQGARAAGTEGLPFVELLARMLVRTDDWTEARDLIGATLDENPNGSAAYLFALTLAQTRTPTPGLEPFLRGSLADEAFLPQAESARLYPATAEGLERLAWAVYANRFFAHNDNLLKRPYTGKGSPALVPVRDLDPEEFWVIPEALRRDPSDPLVALMIADGSSGHHDTIIVITNAKTRQKVADDLRKLFAPALQRLRPNDVFYGRLQRRIARPIPGSVDADRLNKPSRPGG